MTECKATYIAQMQQNNWQAEQTTNKDTDDAEAQVQPRPAKVGPKNQNQG